MGQHYGEEKPECPAYEYDITGGVHKGGQCFVWPGTWDMRKGFVFVTTSEKVECWVRHKYLDKIVELVKN